MTDLRRSPRRSSTLCAALTCAALACALFGCKNSPDVERGEGSPPPVETPEIEEDEDKPATEEGTAQAQCEEVGGTWRQFPNACRDSCEYARNKTDMACAQVMTDGCDCGPTECWNGLDCVAN
jgi:hypothetical protein